MTLELLKSLLVGRTIADIGLREDADLGAFVLDTLTLDNGTQVAIDDIGGEVRISHLLVGPEETFVDAAPECGPVNRDLLPYELDA